MTAAPLTTPRPAGASTPPLLPLAAPRGMFGPLGPHHRVVRHEPVEQHDPFPIMI